MPAEVAFINKRAFTLIELLVTVTIMMILSSIAIPSFISFQKNQTLLQETSKVKGDLRLAQSRAISSVVSAVGGTPKAWGINFTNNGTTYQPFYCNPDKTKYSEYVLSNPTRCTAFGSPLQLLGGTKIGVASDPTNIVFDLISGTLVVNGSLMSGNATISVQTSDGLQSKTITVGAGGFISD